MDPKVAAIIVTYNPEIKLLKKLLSNIENQVEKILVVDNGSDNNFSYLTKEFINLEMIFLNKNTGIAMAQNVGIKKVVNEFKEIEYFVFFDQDSVPTLKLIAHLYSDFIEIENKGIKVGVMGSKFIDSRNHHVYFSDETIIKKNLVISSGSFISKKTINDVGLMKESFFIYLVDTEWCFRAINKGYHNFISSKAEMLHTIGSNSKRLWLFKWFNISIHSPKSHYYIVRNSLRMMTYKYVPFIWKVKYLLKNLFFFVFYIFIRKDTKKYINNMKSGMLDAFKTN